jgi:hypothetical protein
MKNYLMPVLDKMMLRGRFIYRGVGFSYYEEPYEPRTYQI